MPSVRLLAVDEGSHVLGLAYFDGEACLWTRQFAPSASWPWWRRMRWITDTMRPYLAEQGIDPHVVAIEDAVVGANPKSAVVMGKSIGWISCAFSHWYPEARLLPIPPAAVRAAAQAPAHRDTAIARYRTVAAYVTGRPIHSMSEDEAAAVCIGLAALGKLRAERWEAMAVSS